MTCRARMKPNAPNAAGHEDLTFTIKKVLLLLLFSHDFKYDG